MRLVVPVGALVQPTFSLDDGLQMTVTLVTSAVGVPVLATAASARWVASLGSVVGLVVASWFLSVACVCGRRRVRRAAAAADAAAAAAVSAFVAT